MTEILYRCGCGCTNKPDQMTIIRRTETGENTRRLRCAKHSNRDIGKIVFRITKCEDCGIDVVFQKNGGGIPRWCKKHKRDHKLEYMRKNAKRYMAAPVVKSRKKLRNGHLVDLARYDCTRRRECLTGWDGYDVIPCKNCGGYDKEVADVDYVVKEKRDTRQYGWAML